MGGLSRPDGHDQVLHKGPSPSRHLGQLAPKGLSPAYSPGSLAPRLVPLANDLAKLQLSLLRRRCLHLQLITEQPEVRRLGAPLGKVFGSLGKSGPQEPQRTPDVGLAADVRRLGGAQICQILRKGSGASQRMP